jgi:hypothetical protein
MNTPISIRTLDIYTRRHTAWNTFNEFVRAAEGYTPTLQRHDGEQAILGAELEDLRLKVFWK